MIVVIDTNVARERQDKISAAVLAHKDDINKALENIVIADGVQSLLSPRGQKSTRAKLRAEIIRILGDASEKEITDVILGSYTVTS
jgi:flagellar basal body-associated protein FliL